MKHRIETLPETKLIGKHIKMSFSNNKTGELWQSFMPRLREIKNNLGNELYSIEVYESIDFFKDFNPANEFEKWAAIQVNNFDNLPDGMETISIPEGLYAVFNYKGKSSDAPKTYQFIFGTWIPESDYQLDNRPHFAVMGEKYKNEDAESEEELWIPVKRK